MRRANRLGLLAALVALAAAPAAGQDEAPDLRFDPFDRPEAVPAAPAPGGRGARREPAFVPILKSTLVAGPRSLANLGGSILAVGQEAHGYRLVEVRTWDAVFVKNGKRVRLEVAATGEDE